MNPKTRALVWEELRVGGAIAGMCLAGGVFCLAFSRFHVRLSHSSWMALYEPVMGVAVLGAPALCALLLVLSLGNSGHLAGGFSRRVMRLPVSTRQAVAVALFSRLAAVALLTVVLVLCAAALGMHPLAPRDAEATATRGLARAVAVLGMFYLVVQVLDWLRRIRPLVAGMLLALAAALPLFPQVRAVLYALMKGDGALPAPALLALLAAGAGAAYVAGVALVGRDRCGDSFSDRVLPRLRALLPERRWRERAPFASPASALLWGELRAAGWRMPKMTALYMALYLVCRAGYVLLYGRPAVPQSYEVALRLPSSDTAHLFLYMPLFAVTAAAVTWNLSNMWRTRPRRRTGRAEFGLRLPAPRGAVARARLAAALVNAAAAALLAWALHTTHFLLADGALVPRMMAEAHAAGGASLREIAPVLFGPLIVLTGFAWLVMHLSLRMLLPYALVLFLLDTLLKKGLKLTARLFPEVDPLVYVFRPNWEVDTVFFVSVVPAMVLCGWWVRRIRAREGGSILLLWLAGAALLYPFSTGYLGTPPDDLAVSALLLSALAVLPWPWLLLTADGGGLFTRVPPSDAAQHARFAAAVPRRRRLAQALCLLLLAGVLAWMRWPAEPSWKAVYRERGLPTSLQELNTRYAHVPPAENLARLYEAAGRRLKEAEKNHLPYQPEANKHLPVVGSASWTARRGKMTDEMTAATRDYWEKVGKDAAAEAHAAARSGLTRSRYSVNLTSGFDVPVPHLQPLRNLAHVLSLEALLAALENRPGDAVDAVVDILPAAASLADEPFAISQLYRMSILSSLAPAVENVLNRTVLSEPELARLQTDLGNAFLPGKGSPSLYTALVGEGTMLLSSWWREMSISGLATRPFAHSRKLDPVRYALHHGQLFAMDLAGMSDGSNLLAFWRLEELLALAAAGQENRVSKTPPPEITSSVTNMRLYPASRITPSYDRATPVEDRSRTWVSLARTGLAVERFRGAQGRLPERLEELVPEWLEEMPADPWNDGKPLSYRVREDGEFVVYSYGQDREDDDGVEVKDWWREGDMTFTVAPPEARAELRVPAAAEAAS